MTKELSHKDLLEILNLPLGGDFKKTTIRQYFQNLLETLWDQGADFSGKRPFGNSGWEYDIYLPLVFNGIIKGVLNEEGSIENLDELAANRLVFQLIKALCNKIA